MRLEKKKGFILSITSKWWCGLWFRQPVPTALALQSEVEPAEVAQLKANGGGARQPACSAQRSGSGGAGQRCGGGTGSGETVVEDFWQQVLFSKRSRAWYNCRLSIGGSAEETLIFLP